MCIRDRSYTVENTVYTYGTETRTGFAAADLKLSGTDYTPAATTLTAPTVTLKADAASGQPVIRWSKVGGATKYEVYRSATGKANSFSIIRRTSALTYTDVNAAAGNTYYYVDVYKRQDLCGAELCRSLRQEAD